MVDEIRIKKKKRHRGDAGYKIVSVRMKDETIAGKMQLFQLAVIWVLHF